VADETPAIAEVAAVEEIQETIVEQRNLSVSEPPPPAVSTEPVTTVPDGDDAEESEEEEVDIEELIEELHRGDTLSADGRLELCQLSKLLQCVRARDIYMIDNLVSKGVPRLLDYAHPADNETVLGLTASRNDDTLLEHLLQLGADPNVSDVTGRTAAMRACEYGHLQSMEILAEAGIDMKLVDDIGQGQHSRLICISSSSQPVSCDILSSGCPLEIHRPLEN